MYLIGCFILYLAISSIINPVFYNGLDGFFHFFTLVIWYFIAISFFHDNRNWNPLVTTILVLGFITALYALFQAYYLGVEASAFFVQQNTCAAFLNLVIFLVLGVWGWSKTQTVISALLAGLLVILYFSLFTIAGRGALLGNLAGLMIIYGYSYLFKQRTFLLKITLCIGAAFILAGVLNQWHIGARFVDLRQEVVRFDRLEEGNPAVEKKRTSVSERLLIWRASLDMIRDTPWYGSGFGSFHMRYPAYQSSLDTSSGQYAHNDYLQFMIEFGYPGIVMCAGFILFLLTRCIQFIECYSGQTENALETVTLFAAMTAISVHSLFSYNFYILPILIIFSVCLGRFMLLSETGPVKTLEINPYIGKKVFIFSTGMLFLMCLAVFTSNIGMYLSYEKGRALYKNNHVMESEQYFVQAGRLLNNENIQIARALVNLSAAESLRNKNEDAYLELMHWGMEHLDKAGQMNSWQSQVNYVRGLYYLEFRTAMSDAPLMQAKREFEQALRKNKRYFDARLSLARLMVEQGNDSRGHKILELGLKYPLPNTPDINDYLETLIQLRRANGFEHEAEQLSRRLASLRAGWAAMPRY